MNFANHNFWTLIYAHYDLNSMNYFQCNFLVPLFLNLKLLLKNLCTIPSKIVILHAVLHPRRIPPKNRPNQPTQPPIKIITDPLLRMIDDRLPLRVPHQIQILHQPIHSIVHLAVAPVRPQVYVRIPKEHTVDPAANARLRFQDREIREIVGEEARGRRDT